MTSILLASQHSSGSSWLGNAIRLAHPEMSGGEGLQEWLNPGLNWRQQKQLERIFGSNMPTTLINLARIPDNSLMEDVLSRTWDLAPHGLAKDVCIAYKLDSPALRKRFVVVGLVRDVKESFPPGRARVTTFYNNWYYSLAVNDLLSASLRKWMLDRDTFQERAIVAWQIVRWKLLESFKRHKDIVLDYGALMKRDQRELVDYLWDFPGNPADLAKVIVATRAPKPRAEEHREEWAQAFETHAEFLAGDFQ